MFYLLQILSLTVVTATTAPATRIEPGPAIQEPRGSGLQVVVDPVTGQIVNDPSDLQLARLSEGVTLERRRSSWELRAFLLADGGRGVDLDGWADHALTVEIGSDGQMRLGCFQSHQHSPETVIGEDAVR